MAENIFKWKHFESDTIILCVRWKLKYPLSYRNLEEMMIERGLHMLIKKIIKLMLGFKNFYSIHLTISGIKAMHMIHKRQAGTENVLEEINLINRIFCVAWKQVTKAQVCGFFDCG